MVKTFLLKWVHHCSFSNVSSWNIQQKWKQHIFAEQNLALLACRAEYMYEKSTHTQWNGKKGDIHKCSVRNFFKFTRKKRQQHENAASKSSNLNTIKSFCEIKFEHCLIITAIWVFSFFCWGFRWSAVEWCSTVICSNDIQNGDKINTWTKFNGSNFSVPFRTPSSRSPSYSGP